MSAAPEQAQIVIRPFEWEDWATLWAIRFAHLAEHGIVLADTTPPDRFGAVPEDAPEWDFHHIRQVYLSGRGNFWLARAQDQPIGYVGAQDIGGAIELRRMYVRAAYRRRGIGTMLVRALVTYCAAQGAPAIELWTAATGAGKQVYCALGFRHVAGPGREFAEIRTHTRYRPGSHEIRMRLDV